MDKVSPNPEQEQEQEPKTRVKKDAFDKWVESGEVENILGVLQSLAMQGQNMTEMAKQVGVSKRTLQNLQKKHSAVANAIKNGRNTVVAICQNKLMEKVTAGDTTAIIYALKVYGGDFFNDRRTVEAKITGAPAVSVQPQVQIYLPEKESETGEANEQKEDGTK